MKYLYLSALLTLLNTALYAQSIDTAKNGDLVFTAVEKIPEFPGGVENFHAFINENLKYPEVAQLIGINGQVKISFTVETDGSITEITPLSNIGAGCESAAVAMIKKMPKWTPGIQNSKPLRFNYNLPITFNIPKGDVKLKDLKKSDYGFIFSIKGKIYTIDEAELIIGKSFPSDAVEIAEPYIDDVKYPMFRKKAVYLLKMKG